jgi:hypothetical protein
VTVRTACRETQRARRSLASADETSSAGSLRRLFVGMVAISMKAERGRPATIQCDNGTEFTSRVFDQWAWTTGVQLLAVLL